MDTLSPIAGVRQWFAADVGLAEETAFRNGTLQGGYLIMAARALGLSVLPLSGFDAAMVEDASWRSRLAGQFSGQPWLYRRAAPHAPRAAPDL